MCESHTHMMSHTTSQVNVSTALVLIHFMIIALLLHIIISVAI